jgi:hypothetical protein
MLSLEPIEWPNEVEVLVDHLESESAKRKPTRERSLSLEFHRTAPWTLYPRIVLENPRWGASQPQSVAGGQVEEPTCNFFRLRLIPQPN